MQLFQGLHASVLRVKDFDSMLEWYTSVLGLTPVKVLTDIQMAVLDLPGPSYICLYSVDSDYDREEHPKILLNWRTDNIEAVRLRLLEYDVECGKIMESPGFKLFRFYDPEGTTHDCCWYDKRWLPEKE